MTVFFLSKQLKHRRTISKYNEYKKLEFYLMSELFSLCVQCITLAETSNSDRKPLKLWFPFQTKQCDFSGKTSICRKSTKWVPICSPRIWSLKAEKWATPQRCHSKWHCLHKSHNCREDLKTSCKVNDSCCAGSEHSFISPASWVGLACPVTVWEYSGRASR